MKSKKLCLAYPQMYSFALNECEIYSVCEMGKNVLHIKKIIMLECIDVASNIGSIMFFLNHFPLGQTE